MYMHDKHAQMSADGLRTHAMNNDMDMEHMDMSEHGHDMHTCCRSMAMPMDHHKIMAADFKKRFFVLFFLMIPILLLSPMIQHFMGVSWRFTDDSYLLFGLSTVLFFYGGKPFFVGAWAELKDKRPAMMMLITLAITIAYVYSTLTVFGLGGMDFFWELATLIVIMLLGHWIEMKSVMGASKALEDLVALMPEMAHKLNHDGAVIDVPTAELKVGDLILVRPGEKIPIDGVVYDGQSDVNESMVTGESTPVLKQDRSSVIGGSLNGDGALKIRVTKVGDDTFLSQVVALVCHAQESKSKTQALMDKAAGVLFYVASVSGVATFVGWLMVSADVAFAIERAVTVIIIACPHALGLAAPLVTAVSVSLAAKNGLLIRNRAAFEGAHSVNTVVFDKTGTLTQGVFGVTDMQADRIKLEELLTLAASVENNSAHPIAKGIVAAAAARSLELKHVQDFKNLPGVGLEGVIDKTFVQIVSPNYLITHRHAYGNETYDRALQRGETVVFVLLDHKPAGWIALNDIVRDTAKEAINSLKEMQIQTVMITGDNAHAAERVAQILKIDEVIAGVLPAEKATHIAKMQKGKRFVAMTGDGINDAPALAQANVGIAIGTGTDIAIETADVVLVNNNPMGVVHVLDLSRATYRKMVENLFWATGYNVLALPLAAGVLYPWGIMISPALGAVLMSLSTIIVAVNARLLKMK